jgi:peptidyl-prolyl cis-trans isomerase D
VALERWYANNIAKFSTPEFRRVKAVILSPERLAADVAVTEADVRAAYAARAAEFNLPEKRSVQVLLSQDEAKAKALAEKWAAGADWAAMQEAAKAEGAAPVELTDAVRGRPTGRCRQAGSAARARARVLVEHEAHVVRLAVDVQRDRRFA